jgi:Uma2 family endonuclease
VVIAQREGLSLAEFLRLPERKPALEYEDGVVSRKMSPKIHHAKLQAFLARRFSEPGHPVEVFTEARIVLSDRSYVPDLVVFRKERLPVGRDGRLADGNFETAPDVAVEILSPKQSVTALIRRCHWYVANGSLVALLVDPGDETVLAFGPGGVTRIMREDAAIDTGDVLPGFALTARELFDALRVR